MSDQPPLASSDRSTVLRNAIVVAVSLLLIALGCLGYLALGARDEIEKLATATSDNSQWSLAQIEVDAANLDLSMHGTADQALSPDEIRQRFDIFFSRVGILQRSSVFASLRREPDFAERIARISDWLTASVPVIDGTDTALLRALPQLSAQIHALRSDVRALSTDGVRVFARDAQLRREKVMQTLTELAILTAAVLVLLAVGLIVLIRQFLLRRRQNIEQRMISQRLAAIIGTSLDAIVVADESGRFVDCNEAAQNVFGYTRDELIGASMGETIVPPPLRNAHAQGMERYRRTRTPHVVGKGLIRLEAMRKSGEVFPVEMSISAVQQEGSQLFVSYIRDISARVKAEAALVEARDKALAGERAKEELLAVMSHEMRTPLNGVLGTLELLGDTRLTPKQRDYLRVLGTSSRLLLAQVNDVLDISRHDAGKMTLVDEPLNAVALVSETATALEHAAGARGNTISVDSLSGDALWTRGDARRLRQVVMNIVGNAIKFTRDGAIGIEIERVSDEGDWLELRIADTGAGIAPEDHERIFQDFVTLDAAYSRNAEGTGLGLGITRRLVTAMGGTIGVESELGEGSLFWIRLPYRPSQGPAQPAESHPAATPGTSRALDILLIEDNEINRLVIREMLGGMGHHVTEAHGGRQGLDLAQAKAFDLILTDISMPELDGIAVATMIRGGPGPSQTTPIMALTAHALPEDVNRFRAAGMRDVLVKPISRARLAAALGALNPEETTPAQPLAPTQALDPEVVADARRAFGDARFATVVAGFVAETAAELGQLDPGKTPPTVDWAEFTQRVHKISGSAAILGARDLHALLQSVETASRNADAAQVTALWPEVQATFDRTRDALQNL